MKLLDDGPHKWFIRGAHPLNDKHSYDISSGAVRCAVPQALGLSRRCSEKVLTGSAFRDAQALSRIGRLTLWNTKSNAVFWF